MPPIFRYATLDRVKGRIEPDVLTESGVTDPQILEQIEAASAAINTWTRQVFQPYPDTVRVSGRGTSLLSHPAYLPLVSLAQIASINERTTGEFKEMDRVIPGMRNWPEARLSVRISHVGNQVIIFDGGGQQVAWEIGSRSVSVISLFAGFPSGWRNIEMTGWWGWLEGYKKVKAVLDVAIAANSAPTSVVLTDVIDPATGEFIEQGDTIAIVVQSGTLVPKRVELAIVKSIAGSGPYTLTVDPLHKFPVVLPIGTEVFCFGKVPQSLTDVAEFLASRMVMTLMSDITGDPVAFATAEGTLASEHTDNYSYTLRAPGSSGGNVGKSNLGKFTGSARMDLLLRQFAAPTPAIRYLS